MLTSPGAVSANPPPTQLPGTWTLASDEQGLWTLGLGKIPDRAAYKTLSPNGADDTAQINAALDNCPSGQAVLLTTGLFKVSGAGVDFTTSNCTLRGSGPGLPSDVGTPNLTCVNGSVNTFKGYSYCTDSNATQLIKTDSTTNPVITVKSASNVGVENLFIWSGGYGHSEVGDALYRACQGCWISNVAAIWMTYLGQ
jgi:hypothetical protein